MREAASFNFEEHRHDSPDTTTLSLRGAKQDLQQDGEKVAEEQCANTPLSYWLESEILLEILKCLLKDRVMASGQICQGGMDFIVRRHANAIHGLSGRPEHK
jgi:hypothetical protein